MSLSGYLLEKTDFITVLMGTKGGGKTHTLLRILYCHDVVGRYQEIHFCCPHYEDEQNGSYKCLDNFKTKIIIHPKYTDALGQQLLEQQRRKTKGSIALVIDDGTSQNLFHDKSLINFATTSRHVRISLFLVVHADKSVLPSILRKNVDYWFIFYAQTPVLKSVYEEVCSRLFPSFAAFDQFFRTYVDGIKHNGLFIDTRLREYSALVRWFFPENLMD